MNGEGMGDVMSCKTCRNRGTVHTFQLVKTKAGQAITCLRCGLTSHNPNHVHELYCSKCGHHHAQRCPDCQGKSNAPQFVMQRMD